MVGLYHLSGEGTSMDRHTFLLGFLGSLAAAPTIGAAASSVEAAPVLEALPPTPQPVPGPVSSKALVVFRGVGLSHRTKAATSAPSRALPRRRALCTN